MHIKQETKAQNVRQHKEYFTSARGSGVQSGVTKSKELYTHVLVPVYQ